ncbi:hypothetical protein K2X30_04415 [bacterium]|jgi:hypothetical protein|nr:hypothetical protein [bacterium]
MKLKLEAHEDTPVVSISEKITKDQIAALRSGLVRLFKTAKSGYILDISKVEITTPELFAEVIAFANIAKEYGVPIVTIGPLKQLGHFASRKEAREALGPRSSQVFALERSIKGLVEQYKKDIVDLNAKLQTAKASVELIKKEKRRNSDLMSRLNELKLIIQIYMKRRPSFAKKKGFSEDSKYPNVASIAKKVLIQEGFIKQK